MRAVAVDDAEYEKVVEEREHYRELYLKALEQCRKLERGLLGPKRERLPPNEAQLSIAVLGQMLGDRAAAAAMVAPVEEPATETVREHERRKPTGRRPLPETLPRVDIEIVPPEVERDGRDAF